MKRNHILEIADVIEFLLNSKNDDRSKAGVVKLAVDDDLLTADEGIDLIVKYTSLYTKTSKK